MNNRTKKSGFIHNHRYAICFFLYTVIYNFLIVTRLKFWETQPGGTYMFHIIDFKSAGFRPGVLPGAIFNLIFGKHASIKTANIYETVLILLFFLAVSLMLEFLFKRIEQQYRGSAILLFFLYLSGSFTFSIYTGTLGMLDVYLLFFSFLFFVIAENKALRFCIPLLFALCITVHMSAVLNYLIMMSILILYRISIETEQKEKKAYLAVFVLSMAVTAGLSVYYLVFVKDMPMSVQDFNKMLEDRGGTYLAYLDYTFYDYNIYKNTGLYPAELYSIESPVWRALRLAVQKVYFLHTEFVTVYTPNFWDRVARFAFSFVMLCPPMYYFYKLMRGFFKSAGENRLKKFCVFLMMVQFPFTAVFGYLFSLDIIRWFAHAFLISLTMMFYVMYKEQDFRAKVMETVESVKSSPAAWIYCLAYFFIIFDAYT